MVDTHDFFVIAVGLGLAALLYAFSFRDLADSNPVITAVLTG